MISWVLAVTVMIGGEVALYQEFPMASEQECKSEIEWSGNAVYFVMKMGDEFKVECVPSLPAGTVST
jgi:hypothetical protein